MEIKFKNNWDKLLLTETLSYLLCKRLIEILKDSDELLDGK